MSESYTTYGVGPGKHADELQALRDERDRLREALEKVRDVIRGIDDPEAYLPYDVYELAGVAEAALTPAGGGQHAHNINK